MSIRPDDPSEPLQTNDPFFVVGMPRSGTTLLSSFLSAHPRLTVSPETHYLSHWLPRYRHLDLADPALFAYFWTRFIEGSEFAGFGLDPEDVAGRIPRPATFEKVFSALLTAFAHKQRKPRWGEKTPAHFEHIHTLLAWYPHARVIFLMRDPRAVVASLSRVPWATNDVLKHCGRWQRSANLALRWSEERRVATVRFEDLVADPDATLARLYAYLGERPGPGSAQRESSHLMVGASGWALNHIAKTQEPLAPERAEGWKRELSRRHARIVERTCGAGMEAFGYGTWSGSANGLDLALALLEAGLARASRVPSRLARLVTRVGETRLAARASASARAPSRRAP